MFDWKQFRQVTCKERSLADAQNRVAFFTELGWAVTKPKKLYGRYKGYYRVVAANPNHH